MKWVKKIRLSDYNILSKSVLKGTLIAIFILVLTLYIAEVLFDIQSTTQSVMLILVMSVAIIYGLYLLKIPQWILGGLLTLVLYSILMYIFITNPKTFHSLNFWFHFLPVIALVLGGLRLSLAWLIISIVTIIFNSYYLNSVIGDSYVIEIFRTPSTATHIIYITGTLVVTYLFYNQLGTSYKSYKEKSEDLEHQKELNKHKINKLENYHESLISLSKNHEIAKGSIETLYSYVCLIAAQNLDVNRVSIWKLTESSDAIIRQFLYEKDGESDEKIELKRSDFPSYFKAMMDRRLIIAPEAHTNPDTFEFSEVYLRPLNIESMLDAPIMIDEDIMGVICCENQYKQHEWSSEDMLFVQSLSDFIALNIRSRQIHELLAELQRTNLNLKEKNEEFDSLNSNLEKIVEERTKKLQLQNRQLKEYAFINSHMLRTPIANIMGLATLLKFEAKHLEDSKIMNGLEESTQTLDDIVKKINILLEEKDDFDRKDLLKELKKLK